MCRFVKNVGLTIHGIANGSPSTCLDSCHGHGGVGVRRLGRTINMRDHAAVLGPICVGRGVGKKTSSTDRFTRIVAGACN